MRKIMMAGNWKMNLKPSEVEGFFAEFREKAKLEDEATTKNVEVLFAVPYTHLSVALNSCQGLPIAIAAQNAHEKPEGAYTGEISLAMLKDLGVKDVLVGHSERRQYYGETNALVADKALAAVEQGFRAIVCIGESQQDREAGKTNDVLAEQMGPIFARLKSLDHVVLAYEPVWAIGTGLTASNEQAQDAHRFLRKLVAEQFDSETAERLQILYGGSAKPSNISGLLDQKDIDGGLVGGASLKPESFAAMVQAAASR